VAEKPTDDTIALVAFLRGDEWLSADELRHGIERLGFDFPSSQWVAARLRCMERESAPRFESRPSGFDYRVYRVTAFAANGLENQWRGFLRPRRILTAPKRFDLREEV
jgi:hypothetical protein